MTINRTVAAGVVVRTVELAPIELPDPDVESLRFRIEILQWAEGNFSCRLWSLETFVLTPRFQGGEPEPFEFEQYVVETGLAHRWEEIEAPTEEAALERVIALLEDFFNLEICQPRFATQEVGPEL